MTKTKRYGIPYKGSKNAIARDIVDFLPAADTLIDICAGGCAITHAALESGKWQHVIANDINDMPLQLFHNAIHGKYRGETRWISRADFERWKDIDPYVKYCWSFGNNGKSYLYSRELEPFKRLLHNMLFEEDRYTRYLAWKKIVREIIYPLISSPSERPPALRTYESLESLERLQSLACLQSLERLQNLACLQSLERLEISNLNYTDVPIRGGSIVYCDPPYEDTSNEYGTEFDHKAFYDWAHAQTAPVFFSSYEISDKRFPAVWQKTKTVLSTAKGGGIYTLERIYANAAALAALSERKENHEQTMLPESVP